MQVGKNFRATAAAAAAAAAEASSALLPAVGVVVVVCEQAVLAPDPSYGGRHRFGGSALPDGGSGRREGGEERRALRGDHRRGGEGVDGGGAEVRTVAVTDSSAVYARR